VASKVYKTWFTSDLHFGHENIIDYCNRPFPDVEAMNQGLVDRWNSVVGDWDNVWVLGDVVWGSVSSAAPWLEQLNGSKYLVPGNHDTVWAGHKKPAKHEWGKFGWRVLDGTCLTSYKTSTLMLCHFPYHDPEHPDEFDVKYDRFKPRPHGLWLLHGHVHTAWKVKPEQRMINVGTDVWDWTPVNIDHLIEITKGKAHEPPMG